jgi:hypothetical protein
MSSVMNPDDRAHLAQGVGFRLTFSNFAVIACSALKPIETLVVAYRFCFSHQVSERRPVDYKCFDGAALGQP